MVETMRRENPKSVLVEEIDQETLEKMPEWFKVMRKAYERR